MNFSFKLGDIVQLRSRGDAVFTIVKEFPVKGLGAKRLFRIRHPDGYEVRCYSSDLIRAARPEDVVRARELAERKQVRAMVKHNREKTLSERQQEFASMAELAIPLTAEGLPDKRYKPRYTAATSPVVIRTGKRGGYL